MAYLSQTKGCSRAQVLRAAHATHPKKCSTVCTRVVDHGHAVTVVGKRNPGTLQAYAERARRTKCPYESRKALLVKLGSNAPWVSVPLTASRVNNSQKRLPNAEQLSKRSTRIADDDCRFATVLWIRAPIKLAAESIHNAYGNSGTA